MQTIKILNNKYSGRRGKIQIDATLSYLYKTDSFVSKNMRSLEFLDAWASLGLAMSGCHANFKIHHNYSILKFSSSSWWYQR